MNAPPPPETAASAPLLSLPIRRWILVAAAVWLVSGALYLTMPSSPDQFDHNYMGWRILEGDVPYRDFIDPNWPGLLCLHGLATAILGHHLWTWHVLDFLLFGIGTLFLQDLLRRQVAPAAANFAMIAFPLAYVSLPQWFAGQHDVTPGHLLLIALWFHVQAYTRNDVRWQCGTGLFLGAAALVKPTTSFLGVFLVLQALLLRVPPRRLVAHAATTAAVSLAVIAVGLAAAARRAGVRELVDSLWTYTVAARPLDNVGLREKAVQILRVHFLWWPVWTLGAAAATVWLCRASNRSLATTSLLALWLTGLTSFLIQGNDIPYHLGSCFHGILGLAATAVGAASLAASDPETGVRRRRMAMGFCLLASLAAGFKLCRTYGSLIEAARYGDYGRHLSHFSAANDLTAAETIVLAERIRRDVPEEETVLTLGSASALNYLSYRRQPTRFYYAPLLLTIKPPFPLADRWSELWREDLLRRKPRFCFIHEAMCQQWLLGDEPTAVFLRELLAREYRMVGTEGSRATYQVYARK